ELDEVLRIGDGPLRLAACVEFPRVSRRETIRIARGDVVLVEPTRRFDQLGRHPDVSRERLDERRDRMPPRLPAPAHDQRLQRLLRRLLRRASRPLVVLLLDGVPRRAEVASRLVPPVSPAIHRLCEIVARSWPAPLGPVSSSGFRPPSFPGPSRRGEGPSPRAR